MIAKSAIQSVSTSQRYACKQQRSLVQARVARRGRQTLEVTPGTPPPRSPSLRKSWVRRRSLGTELDAVVDNSAIQQQNNAGSAPTKSEIAVLLEAGVDSLVKVRKGYDVIQ